MTRYDYPELGEVVYRQVLPNGLPVVVIPRKGFQKKLAYFVTDYGSLYTAYAQDGCQRESPAGVAHYLEHKLFDMPGGEVSAEFAALGANPNAFTSYDMTAYYFSCTENFEACLRLLLEFVSTPYFTEESVAKEQGIIGQEIDMTADNPETRVFENLMEAMYASHPVRVPILGTRETIAQITPQVLTQCHKAFYDPRNMMLCVVADVQPEQVTAIAMDVLPMPTGEQAVKCRSWAEPEQPAKHMVKDQMEVAMPMFQLAFKCQPIGRGEAGARMELVADLAAEVLFGESSKLYLRLYEEGLIDSSFGGGFETVDGIAMLTCSGDSEEPEAVRDAIISRVTELLAEGIREEDFLRMKRSAMGRRIRDLDSFDSICFRTCAYHLTDFDYFLFPSLFRSIKKAEVLEFLEKVVRPELCCLSVIEPITKEETL